MKFCYIDESGTGNEPFAAMLGIIVDSKRMHLTKKHWSDLLVQLSDLVGKEVTELHMRDFYNGNSPWRGIDGPTRSAIIEVIFEWLKDRKHHIVYSVVDKKKFNAEFPNEKAFRSVRTLWRFMGLHVVLSLQKHYQKEKNNKGHTVLILDNEEREKVHFCDLIKKPPPWTDTYYARSKSQERLDQIVDVPYFGDSRDVALIQLADFIVYFIRRYVEIKENKVAPRYRDEEEKVTRWFNQIRERAIPMPAMYLKKNRCECADLFYRYAPASVR